MVKSRLKDVLSLEALSRDPMIGVGSLVPSELFADFKTRVLNVTKEDIDPLMWDVVQGINQIDGLATVWCCSGHDTTHDEVGHVAWVGDIAQFKQVDAFFKHLVHAGWDRNATLPFQGVQITTLTPPPLQGWEDYGQYPLFWAEWQLLTDRARKEAMSNLHEHIQRFRG